ncbi:MAG: slipin family protein [Alphaproteobacteria bacterium]|jgi:regulator of protease activity HflC (stomatin/prohibitin superfamily)|nr:slipin family protein [Alphaproteobacteria bacterium]
MDLMFLLVVIGFLILSGLTVVMQYEKGVVFTLGSYSSTREAGLTWVFPIIQELRKVDMRIKTVDVPKQEVMTKDNIPVYINAVVYFKVKNPEDAVIKISNYVYAVSQLTLSALKDVIGTNDLDAVLSERVRIGNEIKKIVDAETDKWGIDVDSINVQEVELPEDMKRAMAKQAEAERNRRAMIIAADAEAQASAKLLEAAKLLEKSPLSMQMRTLQTIKDISNSSSQKIVLFPTELSGIADALKPKKK